MDKSFTYLFIGYSAIWCVLFAYIFTLHRRVNNLQTELELIGKRKTGSGAHK